MTQEKENSENSNSEMSFAAHLGELKKRLIYSFLAIISGFIIAYIFSEEIYSFLMKPLSEVLSGEDRRMIYTGLAEAFITYIKLAFFAGIIIAFPIIAYQFYAFIAPGLYKYEKSYFVGFLAASPILFFIGAAFVYYFLFPLAWKFFLSFETIDLTGSNLPVQLEARVSEYLSLVTSMIVGFGLAFQLPVILVLLIKIGLIEVETLKKGRRYAVVILLAIAAILTPPDVLSQIALFAPLYLLYEISILIGFRLQNRSIET